MSDKSPLSLIEHYLTLPLRKLLNNNLTPNQIRLGSFILALSTCLLDASVVTFSLFTTNFMKELGYTQVDINIIAGCMLLGLYLTLPALGWLADSHGPVLLGIIGLLLTPGYLLALWVYTNYNINQGENIINSTWLMAIAFSIIGMGTSSSYFCSLLTCAKIFPEKKGLSISLPVSFYGVSSLILSWIFSWGIFKDESSGKMSVHKVFKFLAILYAFVGLANWLSSVVVSIEKEVVFEKLIDEERLEANGVNNSAYGSTDNQEHISVLDSGVIPADTHKVKFKRFICDPSMPLVLFALFFLAGPLELFIANLGSLVFTITGDSSESTVSKQVALFSIFSTVTRLSLGVITDFFDGCKATVRMIIFSSVGVSILGFILIANGYGSSPSSPFGFDLISAIVGVGYGSAFTLFPTLSATVWGVDILGSTWGLFLAAPAVGSLVCGLFYAREWDQLCQEGNSTCLSWPFSWFIAGFILSAILLEVGWRSWWKDKRKINT
ncbi:Mch1 protein [Martiniozyma asiatica (nom. inval.)]|nr:Mch1 protein [Martiniozyma asiatica]